MEQRVSSIHNQRPIVAPIVGSEVLAGDPAGAPAIAPPQASPGTRVFRNTFVQLLGRVVSLLLSVVTSVLLARYLGRGKLGEYGALYAYLGLYTWLASFGLEQILAREASQRRLQAGSIFFTGSVVGICLAFAGTGFALLLAPWFGFSHGMRFLLLFAAVDIMLLPPMSFASIVFQVDLRQWYPVGFRPVPPDALAARGDPARARRRRVLLGDCFEDDCRRTDSPPDFAILLAEGVSSPASTFFVERSTAASSLRLSCGAERGGRWRLPPH